MYRSKLRKLKIESLENRRVLAGPYAPAAGEIGSDAIAIDDPAIVAWATAVANYAPGTDVDVEFQTPDKAVGPAVAGVFDTVSLGRGGQLTLTFDVPIRDGLGVDFAIFENAATDNFLELGFVEVSSDGTNFFRFENDSLTPAAVGAFGEVDPTDIQNFAGKYRAGFATPFDLGELADVSPLLDVTRVTHVRVIDVIGDGSALDTSGDPIFDPFPTTGSAGIDIESIGVIHQSANIRSLVDFEDVGQTLAPENNFHGPDPNGTSEPGPFGDTVIVGSFQSETLDFNNSYSIDFDSWIGFAYSNHTDNTTAGFENQYSSFTGGGASGSATYGVGFTDAVVTRDAGDTRRLESVSITNTTYAALSMRDGDSFAKKFGGVSGDEQDFLLLHITGKDDSGADIGVVDFYLADFRFADNSLDYIVDAWVTVDLSSIAQARSLVFTIESSDVGPFGINTPTYFAVDDITLVRSSLPIDIADSFVSESAGVGATTVRISRATSDLTVAIDIDLASDRPELVTIPTSVTIPAGERFVDFTIDVIDNSIDEPDRIVTLTASSGDVANSSVSVTIVDDDQRLLSLALSTTSVDEGGSVDATLTRSGDDLTSPLEVAIEISSAIVSVPQTVTIPAGESSVAFTIDSIDNDFVEADQSVTITATSTDFTSSAVQLTVINDDVPTPTLALSLDRNALSESDAATSYGFEDIGATIADESFNNGSDGSGGFQSGGIRLNNSFDPTFGSWGGWSISNTADSTTAGFGNQYSTIAGGGSRGSATYAVASAFPGGTVPTIELGEAIAGAPIFGASFDSIRVTNTTYAALSMEQGDAFAKKFGGVTGDDPDFFLLTIEGLDDDGISVGSVEFYLADFRFDDNSLDYIVRDWTTVDVSSLVGAKSLSFAVSSSDVGMFGINTPTYFALDDVGLSQPAPVIATGTVTRGDDDQSQPITVTLSANNANRLLIPAAVTIPAGQASATFSVQAIDNSIVDGDAEIEISAERLGYMSGMANLTVEDDDTLTLTTTLSRESIDESAGDDALRLVVHRNNGDLSAPLIVELASSNSDLIFPDTVTIPVGESAIAVAVSITDNPTLDGDRSSTVTGSSVGFNSGQAVVTVIDDETPGIVVEAPGGGVVVTEWTVTNSFTVTLQAQPLTDVVITISTTASDLTVDVTRLTFTFDNWDVPQTVIVGAIGDLLLEDDVASTLILSVVASESNAGFATTLDAIVDVTVVDYQPTDLRIGEDDTSLFLIDEDTQVTIFSDDLRNGIQVLFSDAPQTITLEPLVDSRGLIQVDASGGDDTVVVQGARFTSLDGGAGFDQLILDTVLPTDLADFIDGRVVGFEEIVVRRGSGDTLTLDSRKLASIFDAGTKILLYTNKNPKLTFDGPVTSKPPVMSEAGLTQVFELGTIEVHVISDSPLQNVRSKWDVNASNDVTASDALAIINQLARARGPALGEINGTDDFNGNFYDVSGDGNVTALDALQVINELARRATSAAPEQIAQADIDSPVKKVDLAVDSRDRAIEELYGVNMVRRF